MGAKGAVTLGEPGRCGGPARGRLWSTLRHSPPLVVLQATERVVISEGVTAQTWSHEGTGCGSLGSPV